MKPSAASRTRPLFSKPSTIVADPGVRFGDFKVLQRVDGRFIVTDERRALGTQTVSEHTSLSAAIADARRRAGGS